MQFFNAVATGFMAIFALAVPSSGSNAPSIKYLSDGDCTKSNFPYIDDETMGQSLLLRNTAKHSIWVGGQMHINDEMKSFPSDHSKIKMPPRSCVLVEGLPTRNETGPRIWTVYGCDDDGENCIEPSHD